MLSLATGKKYSNFQTHTIERCDLLVIVPTLQIFDLQISAIIASNGLGGILSLLYMLLLYMYIEYSTKFPGISCCAYIYI